MAQHDYVISNQGFASYRSDHNSSLSAIVSNNSGATEPSTTYAYQWWYDTTTDILKMRNADNDAWITMFTFDQTADTYSLATDVELTITENLDLTGSATISGDLTVDTDTLYVDSTNDKVGIGTTSPSQKLEINSGTSNTSLGLTSTDTYCYISLRDDTTGGTHGNATVALGAIGDELVLRSNQAEAMRINSSGQVGIGTSNPSNKLEVVGTIQVTNTVNASNNSSLRDGGGLVIEAGNSNPMYFYTGGSERMRISSNGGVLIDTTTENAVGGINYQEARVDGVSNEKGFGVNSNSIIFQQTSSTTGMYMNDSSSSAGTHNYISFRYRAATIGDIDTTDNSTVRYNTFTGGHWSQFHDGTNPELKKGTVMSLTGDKLEYSKCEKTITREETVTNEDGTEEVQIKEEVQKFEIAGTHEIGSEVTVPNDEYGEENSTTTATVVSNYIADHLVKVKVSDSVADKAVYGVWAGKYNDGDLSVEALGTSKIRIKQGEVLEVGDLLESAGDGTAQKQSDDIIKNSTIAKVTSPIAIETFDDNSFLVSCVLYCG